jgi:peptidoglycan/LPS O-acetylase OafA/YrhL
VLLLCVLLLQGWSRDPAVLFAGNPASWPLTVEAFFYALHPFFAAGVRRLTARGALIAAASVLAFAAATRVVIVAQPGSAVADLPWPVLRLYEFALGVCLAWAFRCGWRPRLPFWLPIALLAAWICALALLPLTRPRRSRERSAPTSAR